MEKRYSKALKALDELDPNKYAAFSVNINKKLLIEAEIASMQVVGTKDFKKLFEFWIKQYSRKKIRNKKKDYKKYI